MTPPQERVQSFHEWLPAEHRTKLWQVVQVITLTLPGMEGHTAYTVHYCPQEGLYAHNVARYAPVADREEGNIL